MITSDEIYKILDFEMEQIFYKLGINPGNPDYLTYLNLWKSGASAGIHLGLSIMNEELKKIDEERTKRNERE
jgi:hypothetical protein